MAVVAHVVLREVSPEQYDRVRAETGWLERPPAGGDRVRMPEMGHLLPMQAH